MSVYIDTSAFYAIVDATDRNHKAAADVWRELLLSKEDLLTSSHVVIEIVSLLHNRLGTDVVKRFVSDNLPAVEKLWVDAGTHDTALSAMLSTPGKSGPSLCDCVGLEIMRQRGIDKIFAYDQHFSNLGLKVVG